MVRLCDDLRPEFDWVLIDSPAGIERGFRNAVAPADLVIVVTNPEVSAVRDADRIIGLIEAEEKGPARLIINRLNPAMVKRGDMLTADDVLELLAVELLGIVPEDESVVIGSNRGQPVAVDGKSRAGEAFQNIARRMNGEKVPFMNLEQKEDIFKKLARMMRRDERSGGY
jgi:septum site-determining protein MinD